MIKIWSFVLKFIVLPILCIGMIFEEPVAFFILGIGIAIKCLALYLDRPLILKIFAPEFRLKQVKEEGRLNRTIWVGVILAFIFITLGLFYTNS